MSVNRGKDFEEQIRSACKKVPHTSVIRLIDPQNGYAGVRNVCDFIMYHFPNQYFLECKSCHGNTLPFTNITDNQWNGLLEMSDITGVIAGYLIWFIDHDVTVFIPAKNMRSLRDCGKKSVNIADVKNFYHIPGKKRRVLWDYDMTQFFTGGCK